MLGIQETTVAHLAEQFTTFLLDQYGVLHNGQEVYPGTLDALQQLQEAGKTVILLSNSGKRAENNYHRMEKLGLGRELFQAVVTSGEVGHYLFTQGLAKLGLSEDANCWVISRDEDRSPLQGSTLVEVDEPGSAEIVILSGSRGDSESWDLCVQRLQPALERKLPCVCLNPDKWMLTPSGLAYGAGTIADYYEAQGGKVHWIGKPYPEMYAFAQEAQGFTLGEVVAVGDSIEHDILGAKRFGCQGAWVRGGILRDASASEVQQVITEHQARPDFQMESFAW